MLVTQCYTCGLSAFLLTVVMGLTGSSNSERVGVHHIEKHGSGNVRLFAHSWAQQEAERWMRALISFFAFLFIQPVPLAHGLVPPSSGWVVAPQLVSDVPQSVLTKVFHNTPSWQLQLATTASYHSVGLGLHTLSINQGGCREDIWKPLIMSIHFRRCSALLSFLSRTSQPHYPGELAV